MPMMEAVTPFAPTGPEAPAPFLMDAPSNGVVVPIPSMAPGEAMTQSVATAVPVPHHPAPLDLSVPVPSIHPDMFTPDTDPSPPAPAPPAVEQPRVVQM
jgi:hypothetical protein